MKRNIDSPIAAAPVFTQSASPVPSEPTKECVYAGPPLPPKSSVEKVGPFTNVSVEKATKLAALEASGATGYVIVPSSTVGSFRRARALKGKKQAPACKEGNVIKEGQVIGFIDEFGTEFPIKSNVAGEVLKILYFDGVSPNAILSSEDIANEVAMLSMPPSSECGSSTYLPADIKLWYSTGHLNDDSATRKKGKYKLGDMDAVSANQSRR